MKLFKCHALLLMFLLTAALVVSTPSQSYTFSVHDIRFDRDSTISSEWVSCNNQQQLVSRSHLTSENGTPYTITYTTQLNDRSPQHGVTTFIDKDETDSHRLCQFFNWDYYYPESHHSPAVAVGCPCPTCPCDEKQACDKKHLCIKKHACNNTKLRFQGQPLSFLTHQALLDIAHGGAAKSKAVDQVLLPFAKFATHQFVSDGVVKEVQVTQNSKNPNIFDLQGYITLKYRSGQVGPKEIHIQSDIDITPDNHINSLSVRTSGQDQQSHVAFIIQLLNDVPNQCEDGQFCAKSTAAVPDKGKDPHKA